MFLRIIWNLGITWVCYEKVEDDEANVGLLEFIPMVFQFSSNLVISCVGIQQCNAYIRWCYPSPRLIWDPEIIFSFSLVQHRGFGKSLGLLKDNQFWEGQTVMSPF